MRHSYQLRLASLTERKMSSVRCSNTSLVGGVVSAEIYRTGMEILEYSCNEKYNEVLCIFFLNTAENLLCDEIQRFTKENFKSVTLMMIT